MKKKEDSKKGFYVSYYTRIILMIGIFVLLLVGGVVFVNLSVRNVAAKEMNYSEKGSVDYRVYLKENDFYEDEFLLPGMSYIASLIKNIEIDYNYIFQIDQSLSSNFYYDVVGKLVISDASEENVFFTKEYILLEEQTDKLNQGTRMDINKTVTIDYDYYNKLAQKFKETYGVDTVSNLTVSLRVNKLGENNYKGFNGEKDISLKIPLTQKAVNINMKPVDLVNNTQVLSEKSIKIENNMMFVLAILLLIISLGVLVKIVHYFSMLIPKKTKFQMKVNKILRTYDRLIANVRTLPNFNDYDVRKVESFGELVDIRDNLKLPIMFYNVKEGEKCYFYIETENKLYLLTLKAVDFEKKQEKILDSDNLFEKRKEMIENSFKTKVEEKDEKKKR